jgi:hypothetical protein
MGARVSSMCLQTGEEARGSQRISASKRIRALAIMVSKLVVDVGRAHKLKASTSPLITPTERPLSPVMNFGIGSGFMRLCRALARRTAAHALSSLGRPPFHVGFSTAVHAPVKLTDTSVEALSRHVASACFDGAAVCDEEWLVSTHITTIEGVAGRNEYQVFLNQHRDGTHKCSFRI